MQAQDIIFMILMAVSLSACCGLRAFVPVTAVSLLAWTGYLSLAPSFAWLGEPLTVSIFALAAILEIVADKIPGLDHALDAAGLVVKPLAGALLASSIITGMDPNLSLVLGIITGVSVAGSISFVKAKTRLLTAAFSGGTASPLMSVVEDIGSIGGTALGILLPLLMGLLVLVGMVFMWRKAARWLGQRRQSSQPAMQA
ncbi:DUF4126 domain-containing protein [bacterium]|nr:DUF4126 domain-containing protein [bacterium]